MKKIVLSKKAVTGLKDELHTLMKTELPRVAKELQEAREHGDLRENAEYTEARNKQSIFQNRVNEIRGILDNYTPLESIEMNFDGTIKQNVQVQYREMFGDENIIDVVLVGPYDANPISSAKVSIESPLGSSLLGRKKGEKVYIKGDIEVPYQVQILDVIDISSK